MTDAADFLAHHGVKGMRWGVRRATPDGSAAPSRREARKAKNQSILEARARVASRQSKLDAALIDHSYAQSPEVRKKAQSLITRYSNEILNAKEDNAQAQKMTTGEKWTSGLGLAGLAITAGAYGAYTVAVLKS